MNEPVAILFGASSVILLLYAVLSGRRHRSVQQKLRGEIDDLEGQNRRLQDDRHRLTVDLEGLRGRYRALEEEKAELDRKRAELEQTVARLDKARADLEASLDQLRSEHSSLQGRVVDFQGEWNRQLTTLEEEIGTLGRQLGEFRKGTRLPIPPQE